VDAPVLILIASFVVLLYLNVPIAFAIGISTVLALWSLGHVPTSYIVAQRMTSGIDSFTLLAIPFFILAGNLMGRGGMATRLMNFANALVGRFTGGLAYVNTLTCMLFGAISGSAAAAISSVGGFMIPEMNEKGYDRDFNVSVTTTAATTGLIIPPSNIMIVYAVVAQTVSIGAMFMAGILPGIVLGLCIMVVAGLICVRKGYGQQAQTERGSILRTGLAALPSMLLILIILGGILGGIFSATEASAVAVAYAFLLGVVVYREVKLREIPEILLNSGKTTAIVMLLIGASQAMSWMLTYEQIPQAVSKGLLTLSNTDLIVLLIINLLLLMVGTFMDMTPAVLIFTPIFLPVAQKLGMHPIHFGIMMIANLCIGLCTPPVGSCLFIGCTIGKTNITRVSRAMLPFYAAMFAGLILIAYVPWITMVVPQWLGLVK
jgi:tripartite ATP-independent transporter DctM subunit